MCGFTGIVHPQSNFVKLDTLQNMSVKIKHRGPDDSGVFINANATVGLAHQRLSIQDLSPLGHQPMASKSGRYVVVYNGEIYNFLRLRKELESGGFSFKGHSDTEVLIQGFETWGILNTITKCEGMFSIAVYDQRDQKLTLIRDRAGEKPLYYYKNKDLLLFGSELGAIEAHPSFVADINVDSLSLYFRHNFIPAPHSIYHNTYKLSPGCYLEISFDKNITISEEKRYWNIANITTDNNILFEDAVEKAETLLTQCVKDQMISDAPLGAFLSGGIDSSLIVSLMQKESMNKIKTFTIGFDDPEFNEAEHAKRVAVHLGTDHTELIVTANDALDVVDKIPQIYDEPFADSSQIPTFLVSQLAKQDVTVSLSGDAGDELFCGYTRYFDNRNRLENSHSLKQGLMKLALNMPSSFQMMVSRLVNENAKNLPNSLLSEKLYRETALTTSDISRFYKESVSLSNNPLLYLKGAKQPQYSLDNTIPEVFNTDLLKPQMWLDFNWYLPDDILAKVDRAAMANSLETRVPFLNHKFIELAFSLPSHLNESSMVGKQILRNILFKHVPKTIIERPKAGFAIPVDNWLRNELKTWASDLLSSLATHRSDLINCEYVFEMWDCHQANKGNFGSRLWGVLIFEQWMRSKQ